MEEKSKRRKKGAIKEDDVSTLLQRYPVKTVLALLQDVAKVAGDGEKIDWNEVVKNAATGIPSARECQMLWRHLAYGRTLTDQFDNAENPMDDDSDLEYEMEAFPAVNRESSLEAAAYVRVLIASDYPIDSHVPNNWSIEAPLTINITKLKVLSDSSIPARAIQASNVRIPVSIEKVPLSSGTCGDRRPKDGKSRLDFAPQRKRRVWSTDDDAKLTASVQKHGEQKWADIASEDFNNDRKASELSLKWANICKKKGNVNAGNSSEILEARKAATRAILIALEPDNLKAARQMSHVGRKTQHESQNSSASLCDLPLGTVGPMKSQAPTERPSLCTTTPNSIVTAAAGAPIATPVDASSEIKAAAYSQNVAHFRNGVGPLMKTTITNMPNQLSSNVFTRNGPTKAPSAAYSATPPSLRHGEAKTAQASSIKPEECAVRLNPRSNAHVLEMPSGTAKAKASIPNIQVVNTISASEVKKLADREKGKGIQENTSSNWSGEAAKC